MNYLSKIEEVRGNWKKLPNNPFKPKLAYAIFPSLDDDFINETLYNGIFDLNRINGNNELIFKSFLDVKCELPNLLVQTQVSWTEFETFQALNLVYEGFYITGSNFSWLGIYHPNDYVIIGSNKKDLFELCVKVYGHTDWKKEFMKYYEDGKLEIYQEDFLKLTKSLF